jgi:hypothetical protein
MNSKATNLLFVEKARSGGYRTTRLYPAAAAILNLVFCAYFEQYLKKDARGFYLSVFLFLEAAVYIVVSSTNFFTVAFDILLKSRIFPTTPTDRLVFVIASNFRRPIVLSLVCTNIFFVIVLFRSTFWQALLAALFVVLLLVAIEVLLSAVLLTLTRRSVPIGSAVVVFAFLLLTLFIGSFVFHYETLIASIPLIRWTVNGILAATHADVNAVIANIAWFASTVVITLALGRRLS